MRKRGDAQLFGQSRTLRIKQLLGLAGAMANLDLAAPSTALLRNRRFSGLFAGLRAQLQPVTETAPSSQPWMRKGCGRLPVHMAPYVSGCTSDVFISYSHFDNGRRYVRETRSSRRGDCFRRERLGMTRVY